MKYIYSILFWIVGSFLKKQRSLEFIGPMNYESPETQALIAFRDEILTETSPYLFDESARNLEAKGNFDRRSYHFGVRYNGKIAAYVRLTPSEFESSSLSHTWRMVSKKYNNYIEFNRLVADPSIPKRGYFGRLLLLYVGLWLFEKSNYQGIVAICRPERMNFLNSFGLNSVTGLTTYLPTRGENYQILIGSRREILTTILKKYLTDNRMFNSVYRVGSNI